MTSHDFRDIDRLARQICEARNGPGSWDTPHRRRADYRAEAQRVIGGMFADENAPGLIRFFGVLRWIA